MTDTAIAGIGSSRFILRRAEALDRDAAAAFIPKILVVDDEPDIVRTLGAILRGMGNLRFATDGASAVRIATEEQPDVVLLDVELPDVDGFQICETLKASPRTVDATIIFVSAHTDVAHEARALDLGALDFIHKPFSPPLVRARVRNHLVMRQQAAELRKAKELAETASVRKSHFFASASHDLRQPLQGQRLFLHLLAETPLSDRQRDLVGRLDECLLSSERLLDAVLEVSSIESGKIKPSPKTFAISDLVGYLAREYSGKTAGKGLRFVVHPLDIGSLEGCFVHTDSILLERIVRNLLSNAHHHTDKGGIMLACRVRPHFVGIEVWDTGPGIPAAQLEAIFEDFRQLKNPERNATKGYGLGLSIVSRLAAMLNLEVSVRSVVGRGSVFAVRIPRVPAPALGAAGPSPSGPELGSGALAGRRILVIEDDPSQLMALQCVLEAAGASVTALACSDEGDMFAKPCDVIVTDYRLPNGLSGIDLITRLRAASGRKVPAVLVTGDIFDALEEEARRHGFELLYKPYDPKKLLATIDALLR